MSNPNRTFLPLSQTSGNGTPWNSNHRPSQALLSSTEMMDLISIFAREVNCQDDCSETNHCKDELAAEKYDTPERSKLLAWSEQMDNNSTIKKDSTLEERTNFTTPPKRPTIPNIFELERWERIQRNCRKY